MRRTLLTLGLAAAAATASAQPAIDAVPALEIRPFAGAFVPTGELRDVQKSAPLFGAQVAWEYRPNFHVLGTFGWAPAKVKYAVSDDKVSIFEYDIGLEYGLVRPMAKEWVFKPFLGIGAGGRTYDYASSTLQTRTCTAGYGALGTEFQINRTALRLEARDYLHCYKSPMTGASKTRNDIGLAAGVAYHFR